MTMKMWHGFPQKRMNCWRPRPGAIRGAMHGGLGFPLFPNPVDSAGQDVDRWARQLDGGSLATGLERWEIFQEFSG